MNVSLPDIGKYFGEIHNADDEDITFNIIDSPKLKMNSSTKFMKKCFPESVCFIELEYFGETLDNNDIEIYIPLFIFNKEPHSIFVNDILEPYNYHEMTVENDRLVWIYDTVYRHKICRNTFNMDSLIHANKYIFGKPWYDILQDCNVNLIMSLVHENRHKS